MNLTNIPNKTLILIIILLILIIYIIFYIKRENLDDMQPNMTSGDMVSEPNMIYDSNMTANSDMGIIEPPATSTMTANSDMGVTEPAIATSTMIARPDPLKCLSEETLQKIVDNFNNINKPQQNYDSNISMIQDFLLNYNNYNIIKKQVDIFKSLSDDQIVCLLERNDPNFCNDFNNSLNNDSLLSISNGIQSVRNILNLYQNQILDVKNIVLPRLLSVINKCSNINKENKLHILNIFKNMLYNVEYISYFLGNNWDLIKKIDQTIKSLN
jgi:hypothetical protein